VTGLDVRPYRPGDETGILALLHRAFGRPAPPGFWEWESGSWPPGERRGAERPTPYSLIVTLNSPLLSLDWVGAHWYYTVGDMDIL